MHGCRLGASVACSLLLLVSAAAYAEQGVLVVHVKDVQNRPIVNLEIGTEGEGDTQRTDISGLARLRLAPQTRAATLVSLQIIHSPPGKDFVMIDPWDGRSFVPPFENESENFVSVVVAERGDRALLESGTAIKAVVGKVLGAAAPKPLGQQGDAAQRRQTALEQVAAVLGLNAKDLDEAIRAWRNRAEDSYSEGLGSIYARNYSKATRQLSDSLELRRRNAENAELDAANAAFYLGLSLQYQGRFRDSVAAYEEADKFQPGDPTILNNLGVSLFDANDFAGALESLQRALELREKRTGHENSDVAETLGNIGIVLTKEGDYAGAERPLREALSIRRRVLPPGDPDIAYSAGCLASALEGERDFVTAESLLQESLKIWKATMPGGSEVARSLNNLGYLRILEGEYLSAEAFLAKAEVILQKTLGSESLQMAIVKQNQGRTLAEMGDFPSAEGSLRRAQAILESQPEPDRPTLAMVLTSLGGVQAHLRRFEEAKSSCRQALNMDKKVFGSESPWVARDLRNLGAVLAAGGERQEAEGFLREAQAIIERQRNPDIVELALTLTALADVLAQAGRTEEAESLCRKALLIDRKLFGSKSLAVARDSSLLGALFETRGNHSEAGPLLRHALPILEKTLQPDDPGLASAYNSLAAVAQSEGDRFRALILFGKALAIDEKTLGPSDPRTIIVRNNLRQLQEAHP